MVLQTVSRGWELSLLVFVLAGVGLVSYWVYRDAAARGMADAPYWGAAVGVTAVVGAVLGGLVAVGVYLSARPDQYAGAERPFDAFTDGGAVADTDPAHAALPPVPEITAERVANASETTLRGYARRYDHLDATGDPEEIRAALADLVAADEADRLGETVEDAEADQNGSGPDPTAADHRRDAGRPPVRGESDDGNGGGNDDGDDGDDSDSNDDAFEWVEAG